MSEQEFEAGVRAGYEMALRDAVELVRKELYAALQTRDSDVAIAERALNCLTESRAVYQSQGVSLRRQAMLRGGVS